MEIYTKICSLHTRHNIFPVNIDIIVSVGSFMLVGESDRVDDFVDENSQRVAPRGEGEGLHATDSPDFGAAT